METHGRWFPAAVRGPLNSSVPPAGSARTAHPSRLAHRPERCRTDPWEIALLQTRRLSVQHRNNQLRVAFFFLLTASLYSYISQDHLTASAKALITNWALRYGLPCSLCRCRAWSASCTARTPPPAWAAPDRGPAAPSGCMPPKCLWPLHGCPSLFHHESFWQQGSVLPLPKHTSEHT